jgi:hypothetical protein
MLNASSSIKVSTALDYASGTATRNGAGLDMKGFEGVLMIVKFAAIGSSSTMDIHAEQCDDNSTFLDLAGTAIVPADDDDEQIFILDIVKPTDRYVRVVVTKDASHTDAEMAIYIQYGAREEPVVQTVADLVTYERHISPAEGTK